MTLQDFLRLAPRGDLWIFGYGSLMWSPGFRCSEKSAGRVHGYHRSLCVYSTRYRGTPLRPGLVMGLCRGGSCWGMAFRVAAHQAPRVLANLWRREMRNHVYEPRFVRVRVRGRREVKALAFVADPGHRQFAGDLSLRRTAQLIAQGRGQRGDRPGGREVVVGFFFADPGAQVVEVDGHGGRVVVIGDFPGSARG
jgi:cation transport protein ChaC